MKRIVLIGAGEHGRVVADTATCLDYSNIEFLDDNFSGPSINGAWPVIGAPDEKTLSGFDRAECEIFVSIGSNLARQRMSEKLNDWNIPVLQHPSSVISKFAEVKQGTIIVAGVVVNAFATIGEGVNLNTGCTIDHDCVIGDFVHISPGANLAGCVTVGARTWVGIGAVVKEGIVIGEDVMIGAGAVVVEDVKDGTKVMGNPARSR